LKEGENSRNPYRGVEYSNRHVKRRMVEFRKTNIKSTSGNLIPGMIYRCPVCQRKLQGAPNGQPRCNGVERSMTL
jgi:hypothetical protein